MSNMAYCRFENTVTDVEDCYNNMEEVDLSDSEYRKRQKLISLCIDIATEYSEDLGLTVEIVG